MGKIKIKLGGLKGKGLFAIVDRADYISLDLGSYRWWLLLKTNRTSYVYSNRDGKTILLHRLIMGLVDSPGSICVDHIDHNGLNNSRINLRTTNYGGNACNRRKSPSKTSVYKGVSFCFWTKNNPWRAYVKLSGKLMSLGSYPTEEEAATAYNEAAIEFFGEFACLNIIP